MCGIVGWAYEETLSSVDGLLAKATDTLSRRGPDAAGYWCSPQREVAFGHRRLAVLDVSESGSQPMRSASGRFVVTFNGEIYNHQSLRRQLEGSGHTPSGGWRGTSDTETLLAALEAWGIEKALRELSGMFAFALWDVEHGTLTLARDRFGEKPLYVARIGQGIAFASELKALELLPGFDPAIDQESVGRFLEQGYVPAPGSIYRSVTKLLPGSYVELSEDNVARMPRDGDFLASKRVFYWSLRDVVEAGRRNPFTGTESEATDELEKVLSAAVERQRVADVPLGAFLSGGIDSTAIVALMQAAGGAPVRTFTIGFEEREYDESPFAERVAAHLGTDHLSVTMSYREALDRIPLIPEIWDEPFADVSQLPTLLVSEVAKRAVTVALSGDGGDELFGGYDRYGWTETAWKQLQPLPAFLRRAMASGIRMFSPGVWDRAFRVLPKGVRSRLNGDRLHKVAGLLPARTPVELYGNFTSSWRSDVPLQPGRPNPSPLHWSGYPALGTIAETFMYRDAVDYMPDDVLVKVDRAAMSVSLETRAPLLDPAVAELAWSLPLEYKYWDGSGKRVLKELVYRYVPRELVDRPKAGFAVPLDAWLRGPMREWSEELLTSDRLASAGLNAPPIRRAWEAHLEGTENHRYFLWNVLSYMAWRRSRHI